MVDFPLNLLDANERSAWNEGRLWLSLDRFERFWPDVGLTLTNGEAIKSAVRDVLRVQFAVDAEWRAAYLADPDAPEDLEAPDLTKDLGHTFFRQINETAGTLDAECVARWLKGPVLFSIKDPLWKEHHPWHSIWRDLLYHLGAENPNKLTSVHGIPSGAARQIVEIAAAYRSEDLTIGERIKAADQEPLIGWDAIAYADYRWETQELSPLDGLSTHLSCISFDRFWPKIVRCTQPAHIDALIQWGRARTGVESVLYECVAFPDDIRAAWHQAWRN